MHGGFVPCLRGRHRCQQRDEALAKQRDGEGRMLHARMSSQVYLRLVVPSGPSHFSMRLAAIDIGTNSVHMIVVHVRPDFSFEVVDREKEMVRLGAGGLDGKKLTHEAMNAALQALSKFARLAQSHQVDEILAVATSATREAENGGAFLRAIERRTGIRARLITGTEEARLIHLAAVYGVDTPKPAVVIDIGGGSVEITRGSGREIEFARSFKIGVIRLTEKFADSDPITSRDERKMTEFIREQVDRYIEHVVEQGFDRV